MWKLSTAFFPCSKEALPGPLAPVLAAVSLLWAPALLLCRVSLWGSREWSQGWSWADQSWSPGWKGATPQAWEWGDTLGHAVGLSPLLLSACAVPLLWSELQELGYWVNNEIMHWRGREVCWCFGTSWLNLARARAQLWPLSRATADPWA